MKHPDLPRYRLRGTISPPPLPVRRGAVLAQSLIGGTRPGIRSALARAAFDPAAPPIPMLHARLFFRRRLVLAVDPAGLERQLAVNVTDGTWWIDLADRLTDAGDWTDVIHPLANYEAHRDMMALIGAGLRYRDTALYADLAERAAAGDPAVRFGVTLADRARIDAYFDYYAALVRSIERRGLMPRSALRLRKVPRGGGVRPWYEWTERDPGIAIGPNGEVLRFAGGRHRTAIAKALGLPSMPVELRLVHTRWLRAEMERTGLAADRILLDWAAERAPAAPGRATARLLDRMKTTAPAGLGGALATLADALPF